MQELVASQRQVTEAQERCRELERSRRDDQETIRRLEEAEQTGQEENDRKLEAAKAVVKQWTSKCKQLKEERPGAETAADVVAEVARQRMLALAAAQRTEDVRLPTPVALKRGHSLGKGPGFGPSEV